jgi:hypothetical protein
VSVFALGRDTTDERAQLERVKQQERLAAIGTLAAGLAHEIRNPLNGAQLHVTELDLALRDIERGAELLDTVHVVRDEIRRLGGLVTEFLDFARPRPLLVKPVVIQEVLARTAQMVAAQAQERASRSRSTLPPADVELRADRAKLEQVLLNLTRTRSTRWSDGGSGRAPRAPPAADRHDRGRGRRPGIPPGTPIFDAFFSTKSHGTGLGLSITHRIVTDHGGSIDVETVPGRTLFRVVLPIAGPPTQPRTRRISRCLTATTSAAASSSSTTSPPPARASRSCCAARATASRPRPTARPRCRPPPSSRPTSSSPTSRCRRWTASSCSSSCARRTATSRSSSPPRSARWRRRSRRCGPAPTTT